jgi:hypothetical protein
MLPTASGRQCGTLPAAAVPPFASHASFPRFAPRLAPGTARKAARAPAARALGASSNGWLVPHTVAKPQLVTKKVGEQTPGAPCQHAQRQQQRPPPIWGSAARGPLQPRRRVQQRLRLSQLYPPRRTSPRVHPAPACRERREAGPAARRRRRRALSSPPPRDRRAGGRRLRHHRVHHSAHHQLRQGLGALRAQHGGQRLPHQQGWRVADPPRARGQRPRPEPPGAGAHMQRARRGAAWLLPMRLPMRGALCKAHRGAACGPACRSGPTAQGLPSLRPGRRAGPCREADCPLAPTPPPCCSWWTTGWVPTASWPPAQTRPGSPLLRSPSTASRRARWTRCGAGAGRWGPGAGPAAGAGPEQQRRHELQAPASCTDHGSAPTAWRALSDRRPLSPRSHPACPPACLAHPLLPSSSPPGLLPGPRPGPPGGAAGGAREWQLGAGRGTRQLQQDHAHGPVCGLATCPGPGAAAFQGPRLSAAAAPARCAGLCAAASWAPRASRPPTSPPSRRALWCTAQGTPRWCAACPPAGCCGCGCCWCLLLLLLLLLLAAPAGGLVRVGASDARLGVLPVQRCCRRTSRPRPEQAAPPLTRRRAAAGADAGAGGGLPGLWDEPVQRAQAAADDHHCAADPGRHRRAASRWSSRGPWALRCAALHEGGLL